MKYLAIVWQQIKNNAIGIIVAVLVFVYLLGHIAVIQTKSQDDKDIVACKSLCFPQQSEYITHGTSSACWCYTNQNTMNKVK